MNNFIAIDIETTGKKITQDTIVGISWYAETNDGKDVRWGYNDSPAFIQKALENPNIDKIFHNAVFDVSFLKKEGYKVEGRIHDTLLLAYLHNPDYKLKDLGLKTLSRKLFGEGSVAYDKEMNDWLEANELTKGDLHKAPPALLLNYAKEDARNTYFLFKYFCKEHRKLKEWLISKNLPMSPWDIYINEYIPLIKVIADMKIYGITIDLGQVVVKKAKLEQRQQELYNILTKTNRELIKKVEDILWDISIKFRKNKNKTGKLKKLPPRISFNWDSGNHLKILFVDVLHEAPLKTTFKGNISVDSEVLEKWKDKYDWISYLLEYKILKKLTNTYLKNLMEFAEGDKIHADFNLAGTATGRFSSSKPNLQNIPKHGEIKELYIPKKDHIFIYSDYSQLELRVAAHVSGDSLLIKGISEGEDLHQSTADFLGITRAEAKTLNFAIVYNASGWRIKDILKLETPEEGDDIKNKLFSKYKELKKYLDNQIDFMLRYNIAISEFGFTRRLPGLRSQDKKLYNHALKSGFNMPIQSMGASLCKRAMIELNKKGYNIVNQVHDSIICEVPEKEKEKAQEEIKSIMENIYKLKVPLLAQVKIINSFQSGD